MATMRLRGASGRVYEFGLVRVGRNVESGAGCYAYTQNTTTPGGSLVYIGHTENLRERVNLATHEKGDCIRRNGGEWVGIHTTYSKAAALQVEQDLLQSHRPPCNG